MLFSQLATALSYTLELTEKELQNQITAVMPIEKKNFFVTVTLSDPQLKLLNDENKISILTTIQILTITGYQGSGKIQTTGSLSYNAQQGAFYYKNPVINQLQIDNVPKQYLPQIKVIAQNLLTNTLSHYPVYTLNDKDENQKLAKSYLKKVTIENKILQLELSLF